MLDHIMYSEVISFVRHVAKGFVFVICTCFIKAAFFTLILCSGFSCCTLSPNGAWGTGEHRELCPRGVWASGIAPGNFSSWVVFGLFLGWGGTVTWPLVVFWSPFFP